MFLLSVRGPRVRSDLAVPDPSSLHKTWPPTRRPTSVPIPRRSPMTPAALLLAGVVGWVLPSPTHPVSSPRSCWPPQSPDVELCVAFVFQFYSEQYLVISIMFAV